MKLNIGCGHDKRKGYTNMDIALEVNPDIQWNIEEGLPMLSDSCVDEVLANNVLTQILHSDTFLKVMNELWRVIKKDGELFIRVPNAKDVCAFQDPMDNRRFTDQTFTYMESGHRRYDEYGKHYGFKPWRVRLLEDNGRQMRFLLNPVK